MKEKIKRHKKGLLILSVIIVIASVAFSLISRVRSARTDLMERAAMSAQETALIEKRMLVDSISATGIVTSVNNKDVTANVTCVEVADINVEVGDKVEAGDVICILDTADIEANRQMPKCPLMRHLAKRI